MIGLFDTHCHLDAPEFDDDRDAVWTRAEAAGVVGAVVPAVTPASWPQTLACSRDRGRYAAIGIHPQYLTPLSDAARDEALAALVHFVRAAGDRVVAIGECGFDGSTETFRAEAEVQRRVFFAHVEAARALDLPLVVHVLKAHGDALAAMRAVQLPRRPGVIHSFSGSAELAREYLALGWHLAMGGAITRPHARRPLEATRAIPDERLLIETDAPDQTPTGVPADVRRCEPAHLALIAQRVAEVRGQPVARIADQTTANARALFGLTP